MITNTKKKDLKSGERQQSSHRLRNGDKTYITKLVDSLYNQYEADFQSCIDKSLSPFYSNGFKVSYNSTRGLEPYSPFMLYSVTYTILASENEKTNTVKMYVKCYCQLADDGNVQYNFCIEYPKRIYHKRSFRWADGQPMNKKLFNNRGFSSYCDVYTYNETLDKWETSRGDEILKYIKKSVVKTEQTNELNLKNLSISNNIYSIQKDSVISMVEEINEKMPTDLKLKLIDDSIEDLHDTLKYQIIGTNNPKQNHTYFYLDKCGDDIVDDDKNPLPLYSYEYNNYRGYYNNRYTLTLTYNKDKKLWNFCLDTPLENYLLESIFELKPEGDLNTLDTLRDSLILFFKRDNILYQRIKKDIEDIKNVKKF